MGSEAGGDFFWWLRHSEAGETTLRDSCTYTPHNHVSNYATMCTSKQTFLFKRERNKVADGLVPIAQNTLYLLLSAGSEDALIAQLQRALLRTRIVFDIISKNYHSITVVVNPNTRSYYHRRVQRKALPNLDLASHAIYAKSVRSLGKRSKILGVHANLLRTFPKTTRWRTQWSLRMPPRDFPKRQNRL